MPINNFSKEAQEGGLWIELDGERVEVSGVMDYSELKMVEEEGGEGREWYVAESNEQAGEMAAQRWRAMASQDPEEFAALIGTETLVQWGLNQPAGPGSAKVNNMMEWFDTVAEHPEEEWGSYDGLEVAVTGASEMLVQELGITPTVAYRHN